MTDNWYIILELEFDPPVEDEQKIADKIEERKRYWTRIKLNNSNKASEYTRYIEAIPKIKKDMIGENAPAIRKRLAEEACKTVYGAVDADLEKVQKNRKITADEGKKIAEGSKYKVSIEVVKKRAGKLGITWVESATQEDYQALYDTYYKYKPQNASSFDNMEQYLKTFGDNIDDLYKFLYNASDTLNKDPASLPCQILRQKAVEKKKGFVKNDAKKSAGDYLCGQCEHVFKDEGSKDDYDQYLKYKKRKGILDEAKKIAGVNSGGLGLTPEQGKRYIDQLTKILKNREQSRKVFVAFCRVENIYYDDKEPEEIREREEARKREEQRKWEEAKKREEARRREEEREAKEQEEAREREEARRREEAEREARRREEQRRREEAEREARRQARAAQCIKTERVCIKIQKGCLIAFGIFFLIVMQMPRFLRDRPEAGGFFLLTLILIAGAVGIIRGISRAKRFVSDLGEHYR